VSRLGELPKVEFRSRAALRRWLEANDATADSMWLVAVQEAQCVGEEGDPVLDKERQARGHPS
jgi:hypothetical protein